jgi:hypothetical protein
MMLAPAIGSVVSIIFEEPLLFISALLTIEIFSVVGVYPEYHTAQPEDLSVARERAETLQSRALTLGGLAFTGFSILSSATQGPESSIIALQLLPLSVGLLFISYQAKELSTTREFWRIVQEKTLSYGFLTVFFATITIYPVVAGSSLWIVTGSFIVAAGLRFWTVKQQAEMYSKMRSNNINQTRLSWFYDVFCPPYK